MEVKLNGLLKTVIGIFRILFFSQLRAYLSITLVLQVKFSTVFAMYFFGRGVFVGNKQQNFEIWHSALPCVLSFIDQS